MELSKDREVPQLTDGESDDQLVTADGEKDGPQASVLLLNPNSYTIKDGMSRKGNDNYQTAHEADRL